MSAERISGNSQGTGLWQQYNDSSKAQLATFVVSGVLILLGAAGIAACTTGFVMHGSNGLTGLGHGVKWAIGGTGLGVFIVGASAMGAPTYIFISRKIEQNQEEAKKAAEKKRADELIKQEAAKKAAAKERDNEFMRKRDYPEWVDKHVAKLKPGHAIAFKHKIQFTVIYRDQKNEELASKEKVTKDGINDIEMGPLEGLGIQHVDTVDK